MSERQTVVAVRLRYNPKAFWFDPVLSTYEAGDHVLVDTERGYEIGLVIDPALEVTKKQIEELKTPLKPVIRALTAIDYDLIDELDAKGREAMPVFRKLIEKHQLDIKPVSVEYLFSGDKAVFYFSSDERVDFRDLVRDLASHFRLRIDMRQIGVRDEARILGGLAHCGEELCCARMGGEFQPVSIRIAKEQDLPLNPAKISGACGRLMCCLRYEFEAYKDFKNRAPKKGALIETPLGQAKVIDFDTPREIITMRLEDGRQLAIPLSEFECSVDDSGKKRPCSVSCDAINRCASSNILMALAALEQEAAQNKATVKADADKDNESTERDLSIRRPRRSNKHRSQDLDDEAQLASAQSSRQERTPRRKPITAQQPRPDDASKGNAEKRSGIAPRKRTAQTDKAKPRPGQHSSGLRGSERAAPQDTEKTAEHPKDSQSKNPVKRVGEGYRRRWRRSNSNPPS